MKAATRLGASFGAQLALLTALGLGVRLLYILVIAPAPLGLDGDWRFYFSSAQYIAHGHFYYRGIFGRAYLTAEHPPLYPLVLGAVSWLGGAGIAAQRAVGCVIGAVSVALFGITGRRIGGDAAGLVAAGIAAVYPPLVVVDGSLMSEPLLVLGILVALLLTYRLITAPSPWLAAGLGAEVGATTLAHTQALLLVPLLVVPAAWRGVGGWTAGPARRAARAGAAVLACAAVLAPWVARNVADFHRLTLATNSNTVIAGANCPQTYYGHDIGWWELTCDARGRNFQELVEGSANTGPALRYIRAHLSRVPLVAAVRVLRTFSLFQPLREGNGQIRRRWLDIVGLALYFPLLILAALGVRFCRRWRWPLLALVCLSIFISAIDSGLPRLRIPADVGLVLLGAIGLTALCRRLAPSRSGAEAIDGGHRIEEDVPSISTPGVSHVEVPRSGQLYGGGSQRRPLRGRQQSA